MTIATSDSGGGAGIQADLKAFARCGVHGTSAIVALTAQNTHQVISVETLPRQFILDQVRAVATDMGVDAVKIGMLFDEPTIAAVDEALELVGEAPVVLDPVMVAESGAVLLKPEAKQALIERIVPRATVVTPNLAEARELTGLGADSSPEDLARAVHALGPDVAVVTGGTSRRRRRPLLRWPGARARSRGHGTPRARPTARAARTPRRWRPVSPSATLRSRRPEEHVR